MGARRKEAPGGIQDSVALAPHHGVSLALVQEKLQVWVYSIVTSDNFMVILSAS